MNELGRTKYGDEGPVIDNIKRKEAAKGALAAIKKTLPDVPMSYGIVKDILTLADEIAYYDPLQ